MPQVFHPVMNTISRVSIFGAVFFIVAIVLLLMVYVRSPYYTGAQVVIEQPVPFSHQHHVADCGIDCRYCHTSVEKSAFAGIPATDVCMNCHSFLFNDQQMLEVVRTSYRDDVPLRWNRVNNVADFAYFHHGIHINKGIGCSTCHGRVDQMPLTWREHSLHMEWCLECHRHPAKYVRPKEFVFRMESLEELVGTDEFAAYLKQNHPQLDPKSPDLVFKLRETLAKEYKLESETNCSVCHR
jgi:hypothetical protein